MISKFKYFFRYIVFIIGQKFIVIIHSTEIIFYILN